jgi:hypothetical protein
MASKPNTVRGITSSIQKMTLSPEKAAIRKITAKPEQYIDAFNSLVRAWIRANIELGNPSIDLDIRLRYYEIVSHEMPADFMVWYFDEHRTMVAKFNRFNMFRQQHGDKIKATAVIQQSHLPVATGTYRPDRRVFEVADAFAPNGGRKKRTQYRRRMRMRTRRQTRTRNRNPRK